MTNLLIHLRADVHECAIVEAEERGVPATRALYLFRDHAAFDEILAAGKDILLGLPPKIPRSDAPIAVFEPNDRGWTLAKGYAANLRPTHSMRLARVKQELDPLARVLRSAGCIPRKTEARFPSPAEICDQALHLIEGVQARENLDPVMLERAAGFIDAIMWTEMGMRPHDLTEGTRPAEIPHVPGRAVVVVPSTGRDHLAHIRFEWDEPPGVHDPELDEFVGRWCLREAIPAFTDGQHTYVYDRAERAVLVVADGLTGGEPAAVLIERVCLFKACLLNSSDGEMEIAVTADPSVDDETAARLGATARLILSAGGRAANP